MRLFLIGVFVVLALAAAVAGWLSIHAVQLIVSWDQGEIATSLAFGLALVAALVACLLVLSWGVSYLGQWPKRRARKRADERRRRGFNALTQGLLAVAAGDAKAANRHARDANELLAEPTLTLLLGAQAAQLAGDGRAAEERFTEMLASRETEFLGLRGLFIQASRRGDRSVALAYLRKAAELRASTPWVINALFDLHVADSRWGEAQEALTAAEKGKLLDSDVARRRKAVLLAAEAGAMLAQDRTRALTLAEEAVRLSPALTPAASLAARLLGEEGRTWRAQAIIENAWAQAPHPDLATAYAKLKSDESPRERASRLMGLAERNAPHIESRLLTAQQWLGLKDWNQARAALGDIPERIPSARVAAAMAEIAQGSGLAGEMHYWLDRAVRAPREPQWVCDNCRNQAPSWSPVCPSCAAFDTLSWRIRTETLVPDETAGANLPALPGKESRAPQPSVPQSPAPLPPRNQPPDDAARAVSQWLTSLRRDGAARGTTRDSSREPPKPQSVPQPKPEDAAPVIFVSPRPPDDPGPEEPAGAAPDPRESRMGSPGWPA
jgi:HemY protein